ESVGAVAPQERRRAALARDRRQEGRPRPPRRSARRRRHGGHRRRRPARPRRGSLPGVRWRSYRAAAVQPHVRDVRRGRARRGEQGLPPPRDGAGHVLQLQERARLDTREGPVRHLPDRAQLPERGDAAQLHLPPARVRADGARVLRPPERGHRLVPVLAPDALRLVVRARPRWQEPPSPRPRGGRARALREGRRRLLRRGGRAPAVEGRQPRRAPRATPPPQHPTPREGWGGGLQTVHPGRGGAVARPAPRRPRRAGRPAARPPPPRAPPPPPPPPPPPGGVAA